MDAQKFERLTKSSDCADLLLADLDDAHQAFSVADPALAMVFRDLIHDVGIIRQRLAELEEAYR